MHQKNSIDYQVEQCQRYAATNDLPIAKTSVEGFCERGIIREHHTAFKTAALKIRADGTVQYKIERPKFQRLMSVLAEQRFHGVICLCWDRLSRNVHDDSIIKELHSRRIDVRFVQATYEQSSAGALHMDIDGMFAAHYSRVVSEKVRATNAKLRAEGKCTNRAPIGYLDRGPDDKPLDAERAPLIKRLFELYATGEWSFAQLTLWAREQGLTTKPRRHHRTPEQIRAGEENTQEQVSRPVSEKTIEHTLSNPFYCGRLKHGGEELPGKHEPLVSIDLFRQVQRVLRSRTTSVHYLDKAFFVYRGLVRCQCARLYSPYQQKGHSYYGSRCRRECANPLINLSEPQIDALIEELLGRVYLTDQEIADIEARAPREFVRAAKKRASTHEDIERARKRLQSDSSYLEANKITLLREGVYTAAQFAAEVRCIEDKLELIKTQRSLTEEVAPTTMLETVLRFSELMRLAQQAYKYASSAEKHRLVTNSFSELVVYNGNVAKVEGKEGVQALLQGGVAGFGRPKFVFSELATIYQMAQCSMARFVE